jgi:hypothetical protein
MSQANVSCDSKATIARFTAAGFGAFRGIQQMTIAQVKRRLLSRVSAGHGYHERGQDHPAPERRERGDYGPHAFIAGVIWEKAP